MIWDIGGISKEYPKLRDRYVTNLSNFELFKPVTELPLFLSWVVLSPWISQERPLVDTLMLFLIAVFLRGKVILFGKFAVEVGLVVEPANIHNFLNCFIGCF